MLPAVPLGWSMVLMALNGLGPIVVLGDEPAYRDLQAMEQTWEGTLERNPGSGKLGQEDFRPFRLVGKGFAHDLHVPARPHVIAARVGQAVRLTGKRIEDRIWPGRMDVIGTPLVQEPPKPALPEGVRGLCTWQPEQARRAGKSYFRYHDARQLAGAMKLQGPTAEETATRQLAQQLGVPSIDWTKQMVVTLATGLSVDVDRLVITRAVVVGDVLTVSYRLEKGRGGFSYPAATLLLDRHPGRIQYEEEAAGKTPPQAEK